MGTVLPRTGNLVDKIRKIIIGLVICVFVSLTDLCSRIKSFESELMIGNIDEDVSNVVTFFS